MFRAENEGGECGRERVFTDGDWNEGCICGVHTQHIQYVYEKKG